MGVPDERARPLARAIRAVSHRNFDLHVLPLVDQHWPKLRSDRFFEKLRIGACDLYAAGPYTALFCDRRRPAFLRALTGAANRLSLPAGALGLLAGASMHVVGRAGYGVAHRRIALVAAFVMVVDHVFDHLLCEAPEERAAMLSGILSGDRVHVRPPLALIGALVDAMSDGLDAAEARVFRAALAKVSAWLDAEVAATRGVPDPLGLGHRLAGVEGTIDGLLFPIAKFVGPRTRGWMMDVSMYVQLMDDWLDIELDEASDRPSPMTTGDWAYVDVERGWDRSVRGLEALLVDAGLDSPAYVTFVREAYVTMMTDVMEAMVARPSE